MPFQLSISKSIGPSHEQVGKKILIDFEYAMLPNPPFNISIFSTHPIIILSTQLYSIDMFTLTEKIQKTEGWNHRPTTPTLGNTFIYTLFSHLLLFPYYPRNTLHMAGQKEHTLTNLIVAHSKQEGLAHRLAPFIFSNFY